MATRAEGTRVESFGRKRLTKKDKAVISLGRKISWTLTHSEPPFFQGGGAQSSGGPGPANSNTLPCTNGTPSSAVGAPERGSGKGSQNHVVNRARSVKAWKLSKRRP